MYVYICHHHAKHLYWVKPSTQWCIAMYVLWQTINDVYDLPWLKFVYFDTLKCLRCCCVSVYVCFFPICRLGRNYCWYIFIIWKTISSYTARVSVNNAEPTHTEVFGFTAWTEILSPWLLFIKHIHIHCTFHIHNQQCI